MDQRRERRFEPNQTVAVKVLGLTPGPVMQTCVLDISGSGMRLLSAIPVPCGAQVEVEVNNSLARGVVCRCEPEQDSYELGVQVSETAPEEKSSLGGLLNGITRP